MTDQFSQSSNSATWSREKIFCEIGRVLTSSLVIEEVFDTVMKLIGDYFSPHNWSLLLIDRKTDRLKFEIVMGVDASKYGADISKSNTNAMLKAQEDMAEQEMLADLGYALASK